MFTCSHKFRVHIQLVCTRFIFFSLYGCCWNYFSGQKREHIFSITCRGKMCFCFHLILWISSYSVRLCLMRFPFFSLLFLTDTWLAMADSSNIFTYFLYLKCLMIYFFFINTKIQPCYVWAHERVLAWNKQDRWRRGKNWREPSKQGTSKKMIEISDGIEME